MRPSLREIEQIEFFLEGQMTPAGREALELRQLPDPSFAEQVEHQKASYRIVRSYGRQVLRQELGQLHERLMARPSFREKIRRIFGA